MTSDMNNFSSKHSAGEKPNPMVSEKIIKHAMENELPCAVAFSITKELGIPAIEIGKNMDLLNYRLTKCQLGLFGYKPEKKIVKKQNSVDPEIKTAIEKALIESKLTCENAWSIAASFGVHKITISAACESMGIKINKCQLGAF